MSKRIIYPNKKHLINKAVKLFPDETRFGLVGFRNFNHNNPIDKKKFAIEQRLKDWNLISNDSSKKRVVILCYLLKEKKPLRLESELLEWFQNKYQNIILLTEEQLDV